MSFFYSAVDDTAYEFKDIHLFCGKSAYQEAVDKGYQGTETQWLESLRDLRFGTLDYFTQQAEAGDITMKDPNLIYIDMEKSYIYRYDIETDSYKPIGGVLGETAETAYRGDRGKIAYDHSQSDHDFVHRTKDSTIDGVKTFLNQVNADVKGDLEGNADTATKLQNTFNITIGNKTKAVDGSEALNWTFDEIGILTEEEVNEIVTNLINGAPEVLDTFKEFADAIGNDPNFATTMTTALSTKLPLAGGTMTGQINAVDIVPTVTNTYNLGNGTHAWNIIVGKNIYAYGGSFLWHNGSNQTSLNCPTFGLSINLPSESGTLSLNGHTHSYAGSASVGGAATSSNLLNGTESLMPKGSYGLTYHNVYTSATSGYQPATPNPDSWYYVIRMSHANGTGYLGELAMPLNFLGGMAWRNLLNGTDYSGWRTILDSTNWSSYCAAASHTHAYVPLAGGTMTGRLTADGKITVPSTPSSWLSGKTGTNASIWVSTATTQSSYHPIIACGNYLGHVWNLGALGNTFGFYGYLASLTTNDTSWSAVWDVTTGNFSNSGTITGSRVYNAIFNDYAEWYEKQDLNEEFEPGDILVWDDTGVTKCSITNDVRVIGVYSDSYGHIVGGERLDDMEKNHDKYVPVGLSGRLEVKIVGTALPGDFVICSKYPGVGKAVSANYAPPGSVIGKILRPKKTEYIEKVKIQIMLA